MKLAVHLRHPKQAEMLDQFHEHLSSLYDSALPNDTRWNSLKPDRIYLGDEFCVHRLPTSAQLRDFIDISRERQLGISLLTPSLTDRELEKTMDLVAILQDGAVDFEVVVNDFGFLHYLRKSQPSIPLSAGRLLDLGPKDPRQTCDSQNQTAYPDATFRGAERTFDQSALKNFFRNLGICRLERDLLPSFSETRPQSEYFASTIYFPYGYYTTGRTCWTATFEQNDENKYLPVHGCKAPCDRLQFDISIDQVPLSLSLIGNTCFFLYPLAQTERLIQNNCRLVYQGFALN